MTTITRRRFLQNSAIAGGICFAVSNRGLYALAAPTTPPSFRPSAYLAVTAQDEILVWATRCEMGQGVRTVLPMLIAEELEVSLERVEVRQAHLTPEFKGIRLRTSGSGSASGTWKALREAGASARTMLIAAAAQQWNVEPDSCRAENCLVIHDATKRRFKYGEVAGAAAKLPVPKDVKLKDAAQFKVIGKPHKRVDGKKIVTGKAGYGIDVRQPGMLLAVARRCPVLKGKLGKWDATRAKSVPGVVDVVPFSSGFSEGLAVVADRTWTAMKARDLIDVQWDLGEHRDFSTDALYATYRKSLDKEGLIVRKEGELTNTPNAIRLDSTYEWHYQAHAPLETMNCTALVRDGACEMWVSTQAPEQGREEVAKLLGIAPEKVNVNITMLGGGFGRRLYIDYMKEAAEVARGIKAPVQLLWTREDDMVHGYFNPPSFNRFVATIEEGKVSLLHRDVSQDLTMYPVDERTGKAYYEAGSPWGALDNPYKFHALQLEFTPIDSPVPTGPWRAVMYPGTVFARESFMDELAHEMGVDTLQFRLNMLQPNDQIKVSWHEVNRARMTTVLKAVREKAGWDKPLPSIAGRRVGRGVASNVYHSDSYIAHVAEVSVGKDGDVKVHRLVAVADIGQPLNPLGIEGQMESAAVWALTSTLKSSMTFRNGRAEASNYSDYPLLTISEMPAVETHILPSTVPPAGFGEHGVPSVPPAVVNAVFAATGKRVRQLPIRESDLV
jgi:isoquinoline 1-oxidoreductase beta subunit